MAGKRGRPRGYGVNTPALEFQAAQVGLNKVQLASAVGMSTGHLADCLHRGKGISLTTAHRIAEALRCPVELICPELTTRFVAIRKGDPEWNEAA